MFRIIYNTYPKPFKSQYKAGCAAASSAFAAGTTLCLLIPVEWRQYLLNGEWGFPVSQEDINWLEGTLLLGAAFACAPVVGLLELWGRKATMLLCVLPFITGWLLLLLARNVVMLYAARFMLGFCLGAYSVAVPIYNIEIAKKGTRGKLGGLFQMLLVSGILFCFVVGRYMDVYITNCVCAGLPLLFAGLFWYMPETPYYQISKGKLEQAAESLKFLRADNDDTDSELAEMEADYKQVAVNLAGMELCHKVKVHTAAVCVLLVLFQQFGGPYAAIFFTDELFELPRSYIVNINFSTTLFIATIMSLIFINKLRRRTMLTISAAFMAVTNLGMLLSLLVLHYLDTIYEFWFTVWFFLYIISFSFGFSTVPWVMLAEMYGAGGKIAYPLAIALSWLCAIILIETVQIFHGKVSRYITLSVFIIVCTVAALTIHYFLPETKGKTSVEIQKSLGLEDEQ